eukprot:scaffold26043_cov61-Phaeocystis_antarctica.AAC.4
MATSRRDSSRLPVEPSVAKSPSEDNSSSRAVSWSGRCSSTPTAWRENSAILSSSAATSRPLRRILTSMACAMSAARIGERQRRQKSSARSRAPARGLLTRVVFKALDELLHEADVHAAPWRPSEQDSFDSRRTASDSLMLDAGEQPKAISPLEIEERGQVDFGGLGAPLHEQLDKAQVKSRLDGVLERALEGHLHLHWLPLRQQVRVLQHVLEDVHAAPLHNRLQQTGVRVHLLEPLAYHEDPVAVRRVDVLVVGCILDVEPEDVVEAELFAHQLPPLLGLRLITMIILEQPLLLDCEVSRRWLQRQQRTQLAAAVEVARGSLKPRIVRVTRLVHI